MAKDNNMMLDYIDFQINETCLFIMDNIKGSTSLIVKVRRLIRWKFILKFPNEIYITDWSNDNR